MVPVSTKQSKKKEAKLPRRIVDDPGTLAEAEGVLPSLLGLRSGCSSHDWVASAWVAAGRRLVGCLAIPANRLEVVEEEARPFSCLRGGGGSCECSSLGWRRG